MEREPAFPNLSLLSVRADDAVQKKMSKINNKQQQTHYYKQIPSTYLILLLNKKNRKSEMKKIRERKGHNS